MNLTETAAWIGATTGTLALLLQVVKWIRSGTRLDISSNSNMIPIDPTPDFPSEPHLMIWVRNVGDAPTTLTTLALEYYRNRWSRLIRRGGEHGVVLKPAGDPLPMVLQPGQQWSSIVKRGSPVEKARDSGFLVCAMYHTMSRKPTRHLVRFTSGAGG